MSINWINFNAGGGRKGEIASRVLVRAAWVPLGTGCICVACFS